MLRSAGGAALMGIGGVMAFGCSIGQGLTGLSTLALASFIAVAGIMLGTAAGLRGALRVRPLAAGLISRPPWSRSGSPTSACDAPDICRRSPSTACAARRRARRRWPITRSIWSSMPSFVSHSSQSLCVDLAVLQRHRDALQRQRFAVGIDAAWSWTCRRRAPRAGNRKARDRYPRRRRRAARRPACWCGPIATRLLELAVAGFLHHDLRAAPRRPRRPAAARRDRCSARPGRDHFGDIGGIAALAQQMIGAGQRDEALRVLCGHENAGGVVDADGVVGRRMHDQQRLVQFVRPARSGCARRHRRGIRA